MKNMIKKALIFCFVAILFLGFKPDYALSNSETTEAPIKGIVTMIDFGSKKCIPCKMMAPILAELEQEYKGKAAIIFIDIREEKNREYIEKFRISGIPTQVFFDQNSKEVARHSGFMDKKSIVAAFEKLGVR